MNLCLSQDQVLVISDFSFSLFFKQVNFKIAILPDTYSVVLQVYINFLMKVEYDCLGEGSPEEDCCLWSLIFQISVQKSSSEYIMSSPHFSSRIAEQTKRECAWKSPPRLTFLVWGHFHTHLRFTCATVPEEKLGLLVV